MEMEMGVVAVEGQGRLAGPEAGRRTIVAHTIVLKPRFAGQLGGRDGLSRALVGGRRASAPRTL
jgi:hypothetical protein